MNPFPESSSAAAGASSSTAPPPPAPLPLLAVPPPPPPRKFYPLVKCWGMAADPAAAERPVRVSESLDSYEVRIEVPCPLEALVTLTTGRISGNRGMSIHARVSWSQMRTGGAFVYRPGSRRVYGGGEFKMEFDLPGPVRRLPYMPRVQRCRSFLTYYLRKVPAEDPDEPEVLGPEYRTVHCKEEF